MTIWTFQVYSDTHEAFLPIPQEAEGDADLTIDQLAPTDSGWFGLQFCVLGTLYKMRLISTWPHTPTEALGVLSEHMPANPHQGQT